MFSLLPYDKVSVFCRWWIPAIYLWCKLILVNKEAKLYFLKLVLFLPYLASAWLKNNNKTWRFAEQNQQINWSVCRYERICGRVWKVCFVHHWKIFMITMFGPRPMTLLSSHLPKKIKKTLHKRMQLLFFFCFISLKINQSRSLIKRLRKEPKNL